MSAKKASVWQWLPTLYIAEALPYIAVNVLTVYFYTRMGVGASRMAFYTGWLYLPWVIKPFWSPFVDIFATKRQWVLCMQFLLFVSLAGVALGIPTECYFALTLVFFWITAFCSATHDIAADGYYMIELTPHDQAMYVGVRSTFYRIGSLIASGGLVWLAGYMEQRLGSSPNESVIKAWSITFAIIALFFGLIALYHLKFLPKARGDVKRRESSVKEVITNLRLTLSTFFAKKGIIAAVAFMLLYRLPEALCIKLVGPFLLAPHSQGGLAMTTEQVGVANGITGVIAILLGGILGGMAIARGGLRKWLWPMAAALVLPCVLYSVLALVQPELDWQGLALVNVCIFVEQFGYGFGFTAFMMYLIYFSEGEWKTSHYAFCTAFMALGMMLPGMAAGWIYEWLSGFDTYADSANLGYFRFFLVVVGAGIATAIACLSVKIEPKFGQKEN